MNGLTDTTIDLLVPKSTCRLDDKDLASGVELLQGLDCVQRWQNKDTPADDIEAMEIGNVIRCAQFHVGYQRMRKRFCDQYGIDEREFVRQILVSMTR